MKTTYCLLCSFLYAVAIPMTAPAQQAANPYDWFKLGETVWALSYAHYYQAISDSLQDRLKEHQALMKKLDVPSDVLSAFSTLAQTATTLPFSKPLNQWEDADRQKLKNELWPALDKFSTALQAYVSKERQRRFFYWLGLQSLRLGWSIPTIDLEDFGYTLAQEMPAIESCVSDFIGFNSSAWSEFAATLTPEARDAIKTIASIGAKSKDPLGGGITAGDLDKMAAAAQRIRHLARDNKLVR